jgi:hypothetical protein
MVSGLSVGRTLVDGEAVVLMDDGRSDFHALMTKRGGAEASLIAFDVLRVEGVDLRLRPLEARREALMQLVDASTGSCSAKLWPPRVRWYFRRPASSARRHRVEAEGSFYKSGPSRNWFKTKKPEFREGMTAFKDDRPALAAAPPSVSFAPPPIWWRVVDEGRGKRRRERRCLASA